MSTVTQAMQEHHRKLDRQLAFFVTSLTQRPTDADAQAFAAFLKNDLLAHAAGEEAALYPVMDELVRAHGKPTATMRVDHEYIHDYVGQIQAVADVLAATAPGGQPALRSKLVQLALELRAIFALHLAKEERIYLPLFEQALPPDAQQQTLDAMHAGAPAPAEPLLDVRTIPPAQRHALIFQTFQALAPGAGFELVNDHNPKPLYYQFAAERKDQFTWQELELGPRVWRVRIGKAPVGNRGQTQDQSELR